MCLVDGQVLPFDLTKILSIFEDKFVRGEQDVELEVLHRSEFALSDNLSRPGGAHVADNVEIWGPSVELHLPGGNRGQRDDNEEGAVLLLRVEEV